MNWSYPSLVVFQFHQGDICLSSSILWSPASIGTWSLHWSAWILISSSVVRQSHPDLLSNNLEPARIQSSSVEKQWQLIVLEPSQRRSWVLYFKSILCYAPPQRKSAGSKSKRRTDIYVIYNRGDSLAAQFSLAFPSTSQLSRWCLKF